jgi:glycosyltransferase involved in cell wall biosynthesis
MNDKNITFVANLYPTDDKPFFGTFVKNSAEEFKNLGLNVKTLVLPQFGSGITGYAKFYAATFHQMCRYKGTAYIHYISHSAPPIILAKVFNPTLKVALHYHGSDAFPETHEGNLRCWIKRKICTLANKIANQIIVPSNFFAQKIADKFSINKDSIIVSPSGGIDLSVFYPDTTKVISDHKNILFAGRMIKGKGCLIAAETAVQLASTHKNLHFTFVGDGPQLVRVKEILTPLIDNGTCEIKPALSQNLLAAEFRKSDFFLFPSHREGESLGLVVVEAMACGTIPLAIKQGAIAEVVDNEERILCIKNTQFTDMVKNAISLPISELNHIRNAQVSKSKLFDKSLVSETLIKELFPT